MKLLLLFVVLATSVGVTGEVFGQIKYPFEVPENVEASLNIDTTKKTAVNDLLLGLNCNWPENQYGKTGYNHPEAQELIRSLKPISLRFPHGVWSNFYDWESDGRRITDDYKTPYDSAVADHPDLKYGFSGFNRLHRELDFDVLFTFNVNYDSSEKSVRRLRDRRDNGFDVKRIELGNEIFWKTQRSRAVSDVEKYIAVSKEHAAALKEAAPSVQVSVPIHWRDVVTNPWNVAMMKHDYFDAITIHKHMGENPTSNGAARTLAARTTMLKMAKDLRSVFPEKPLWVSEWSVSCGESPISILAMADVYLGFFEHPELFGVADYFQINASHAMIEYDRKTGVHRRTSYGAAYEIVRGVFESSQRCESQLDTPVIGDDVQAVSAEAVIKDGKVIVFAINKTPREVPLHVTIDDAVILQPARHQTLAFNDLNSLKSFALDEDVLTEVDLSSQVITLPPLSINRITP